MSETPSTSARARRRWITVGEIVGVLALVVAGLSFWDSHEERTRENRERAAADRRAAAQAVFVLRGVAEDGGQRLRLEPVHDDQVIQRQSFIFPSAVRGGVVRTTGDARIEADWIADGVKAAARKVGVHADGGDLSVPVGITTTVLVDGSSVTDQSIYLIGYRLHPRLILGPKVELVGLSLARRGVAGDLGAKVQAMWPWRVAPTSPSP